MDDQQQGDQSQPNPMPEPGAAPSGDTGTTPPAPSQPPVEPSNEPVPPPAPAPGGDAGGVTPPAAPMQ